MAQPASRTDLINYCKRKLGAPVLEINVADEQIDDLVDDALQFFHERHFDGVQPTFLKYQFTQDDIDRGRAPAGNEPNAGIVTSTAEATIVAIRVSLLPLCSIVLFRPGGVHLARKSCNPVPDTAPWIPLAQCFRDSCVQRRRVFKKSQPSSNPREHTTTEGERTQLFTHCQLFLSFCLPTPARSPAPPSP